MKTRTRQVPIDPTRAFQPSADRGSLWLVGQYDDALRMLRNAVLGRQGLHVLIGEPGTGKTLLAHALAVRVQQDAVVIGRLLYPMLEGMDLRAAIAEAFDLQAEFKDGDEFVEQFRRFIDDTTLAGRRALLIVDEAENLTSDAVMELRRLLYGGQAGDAAALSVLLVGHRTLLDTLRAGGVEPDVLCHLRPLTREQTVEYVSHRLRAAGHRRQLFTPTALRKIWVVSEGIPRVVNGLCIDALTGLRLTTRRKVSASMIDRAAREPDAVADGVAAVVSVAALSIAEPPVRVSPRRRLLSLAGGAAIAATLFAALIFTASDQAPWVSPRPAATTASTMPDNATSANASAVITDTEAGSSLGAVSSEATPPAASVSGLAAAVVNVSPAVTPPPAVTGSPRISAAAVPRERRAIASAPRRPDDADDPGATIEWLLKERRLSR